MELTLEITVEVEPSRARPVFLPGGKVAQSWVGEWESSDQALSQQVVREFQRWFEGAAPRTLEEVEQ